MSDDTKSLRLYVTIDTKQFIEMLEEYTDSLIENTTLKKFIVSYGIKNPMADGSIRLTQVKRNIEVRASSYTSNILDALIRQKHNLGGLSVSDKKVYYENYIEYGVEAIREKWEEISDKKNFILILIKEEISRVGKSSLEKYNRIDYMKNGIIRLELGKNELDKPISIFFNDINNSGYHMGIVGTTGSGKTQLALDLSSQIVKQSPNTNIVFLDYAKGDVAANSKYVDDINADVIDVKKNGIAFNPFDINEINDMKIEELKELIVSNQPKIGANQKMELFDIIKRAFEKNDKVDFNIINEEAKRFYASNNKGYNVLTELLHKITVLNIFRQEDGIQNICSFMDKSLIIDLHNIESSMGAIKEIVAFFILYKVYTEAIKLPDSDIDLETGSRVIRTVIMLDEGHNYLNAKNPILQKMLRELRSKGISIIIITQGFSDFKTKSFDYSDMMNWVFVMKSQMDSRSIQQALNTSKEESMHLQMEIANLSAFELYGRGFKDKAGCCIKIRSDKYN